MNRIATILFVLISAFSIYAAEQPPDLAQTKLDAEKGLQTNVEKRLERCRNVVT
jgi:hypothetical protein